MKKKKTVLTYGTFDMFHVGHLRLLKRISSMGDELIVAVSSDEFNTLKNKKTLIPFEQRAEIVEGIRYVDKVIREDNWEQKVQDIQDHHVDLFVMGDDWKGKFDFLQEHCDVQYLERTKNISTTQLKRSLSNFLSIPKENILQAFEVIEALKKDFE